MMTLRLLLYRLIDFYSLLIVIECLLSWFRISGSGLIEDIYGAIATVVDPYLDLFRRILPPVMGVDFSPVVAILVLQLVERLIL